MSINIKRNQLKRVVIVGGGLGGLRLAEDLSKANLQVVLIDKNNFHQFPPLIYQIASAGIDPNSMLLHLHTSLHTTTHFTVILAWAFPTSLAVTKGIIVIFFSSA